MSIQIVEIAQPSVIDTVAVAQPSTVAVVEVRQGPAGPSGGGGSVAWDDLTGTASDVPFLPVAAPSHSEGLVFYDSTDKSLTYYNDEADVSMNIGRELWVRVRNDSGSPILNGKVVYINDAIGQLPTIRLARADSAATSRVIGIATHDIGNNEFGYVTTTGEVKGLATNAFDDGDLLFLSAVTAGEMTTTAPLAPNRVIQVATVLHAHPTQGKLYCHPETDSVPSTGIVDSTATGRALITAANAAAARTTLELAAAATASTPNTLVLRDANGDASFGEIDTSGLTVTGGTLFGDASLIQFDAVEYYYGAGAAAAHRTALGSGATGDELFRAASASAANTILKKSLKLATSDHASRTNSTDFVDDDVLSGIVLEANSVYRIILFAWFTCDACGVTYRLSTSGALDTTTDYLGIANNNGVMSSLSFTSATGIATAGARASASSSYRARHEIEVITSAQVTLALQWGQVSLNNGQICTRKADSFISSIKL